LGWGGGGKVWPGEGGKGREAAVGGPKGVPAFEPPAVALRVEVGGEVVADGEAVGRHPMVGEREGRGEIGWARTRCAVDAGLEGIALAAAQPLRQAPIGAAAGQRETPTVSGVRR